MMLSKGWKQTRVTEAQWLGEQPLDREDAPLLIMLNKLATFNPHKHMTPYKKNEIDHYKSNITCTK